MEVFFFFRCGSQSTWCRSNLRPPPVAKLEDQRRSLGRFSVYFFFYPCAAAALNPTRLKKERRVGGEEEKQQQIRWGNERWRLNTNFCHFTNTSWHSRRPLLFPAPFFFFIFFASQQLKCTSGETLLPPTSPLRASPLRKTPFAFFVFLRLYKQMKQ